MEKSEALRLADAIEKAIRPEASLPLGDWARAAAELRRLSAVEAQRDALLLECIDIVALHGGSVEIEAAIRAKMEQPE